MQAAVNAPVQSGQPARNDAARAGQAYSRLTGARSEIVFGRLPVDDPKVRQPDITRARALLGLGAARGHRRGLKLTSSGYRACDGAPMANEKGGQRDRRGAESDPVCRPAKGNLIFEETRIICQACRKAYPIRDGIR